MNRSYCYILLTIIVQELLPNGKNHNNIGKNNGRKSVKKPELEFLLLSNRGSGKEAANCATSRTQNPKTQEVIVEHVQGDPARTARTG